MNLEGTIQNKIKFHFLPTPIPLLFPAGYDPIGQVRLSLFVLSPHPTVKSNYRNLKITAGFRNVFGFLGVVQNSQFWTDISFFRCHLTI